MTKGDHPNSKKNLKPFGPDNPPKGAKKGVKRVETKTIIRELLECTSYHSLMKNRGLLDELEEKFDGVKLSGRQLLVVAQIAKALKGDTSAFNAVFDRMEGKPKQVNENINTDMNYMDFVKSLTSTEWTDEEES